MQSGIQYTRSMLKLLLYVIWKQKCKRNLAIQVDRQQFVQLIFFTKLIKSGHRYSPETRVFILVALACVNMSNWFNIKTRLASFYRK